MAVLVCILAQAGVVSGASGVAAGKTGDAAGRLEVRIPWGGGVTWRQAHVLAVARAWLDGLEACAGRLAGRSVIRLAELDPLRRQALAALAGAVTVTISPLGKTLAEGAEADNASDGSAGDALDRSPCATGESRASATLEASSGRSPCATGERLARSCPTVGPMAEPTAAPSDDTAVLARAVWREPPAEEVTRLLARTDALDRVEEALLVLHRLQPEAQDLAARQQKLRRQDTGLAQMEGEAEAAERLNQLVMEAEACMAAVCAFAGAEGDARAAEALDRAWSLAPEMLFLRVLRAEERLRQDRPQAALELLAKEKAPAALMEETSAEADRRLYARVLHLRALALLRTGKPALAGAALDDALRLAPRWADLWAARGAAFQVRERFGPMCADYHQACALGRCDALAAARDRGLCLPPAEGKEASSPAPATENSAADPDRPVGMERSEAAKVVAEAPDEEPSSATRGDL